METLQQSNKKPYSCKFPGCSSLFNRPYRLAQHQLAHSNLKPFACTQLNCNKAFTNKSHLDRHINSVHKKNEVDVIYSCPQCMKKYANRQNLKRHMKISHTKTTTRLSCEICKLYFNKKHKLRAHMYIHNGLKTFRCSHCNRDFQSLYEKKKHVRNHKTYCCEHCNTKFNRWTDLVSHKRNNHQSSEYICHDCGKSFKERQHIIRHIKKHFPTAIERKFYCPFENCYRHYSRNSNLKQHILIKHEGKAFDCKLCGAQLSSKAKLNEHVARHTQPGVVSNTEKPSHNSRKKRKDFNVLKELSAKKLAGVVVCENGDSSKTVNTEIKIISIDSNEATVSNETTVISTENLNNAKECYAI